MPCLSTLTFFHGPDGTRILAQTAHACGDCGEARFFFINRSGRTICIHCNNKAAATRNAKLETRNGTL